MSFKGYKYTFRLNASHSLNKNANISDAHFHTFEITIYIRKQVDDFVSFAIVENKVEEYLNQFSGKYLNQTDPFDKIEPIVENIGKVFYENIEKQLIDSNFELWKIEISETPSRIYSISEALDKNNIRNSIRGQKLQKMLQNVEENSPKNIPTKLETKQNVHFKNDFNKPKKIINVEEILSQNNQIQEKVRQPLKKILIAVAFIISGSVALMAYLKNSGCYPLGYDVYGQLFKSNMLYESIKGGNIYPLFNNLWYNGIEPFRYTAPLPFYFVAFLQFLASGSLINSYFLLIGVSFIIGALGWLLWGVKFNRIFLGTFLGFVWFFIPNISSAAFMECNFSIIVINCILPYLIYFIWNFVSYREIKSIYFIIVLNILIALSNILVGIILSIAIFIFLLIIAIANKRFREPIYAIAAMTLSYFVIGLWSVPALQNGFGKLTSEVMTKVESHMSFNIFARFQGNLDFYYVGLSVLVISIAGIILSKKKSIIPFAASAFIIITVVILTTSLLSDSYTGKIIIRLTPLAYAFFLLALMEWKTCKKLFMVICCILIVADAVPSIYFKAMLENMNGEVTDLNHDYYFQTLSLDNAKKITNQRISVIDLNSYGSFPSFEICYGDSKKQYVYGREQNGAATSGNLEMMNTAYVMEYFDYLFDKNVELGADTVVLKKAQLADFETAYPKILKSAEISGYKLIEDGNKSLVFHKDTPKAFGVVTDYEGITIGTTASYITLLYPYFCAGNYINIEDYTYDDLKSYKKIYLSGFFYNNKQKAENLIQKLADSGIKVYIDMSKIPADPLTSRMTFLDVSAQPIAFKDKYPDLILKDKIIHCDNFAQEYSNWNTVYLNNLNHSDGYAWFSNNKLDFIGTGKNENTVFMGFNLLFHAIETRDNSVVSLMREVIGIESEALPNRKIVPIDISYDKNTITINSPEDNVNTTIAYYDNFTSDKPIRTSDNLLIVNKGITVIHIKYPSFLLGIIISCLGLLLETILIICIYKHKNIFNNIRQYNSYW